MLWFRVLPDQPTSDQLKARAASGMKGSVKARHMLQRRVHDELAASLAAQNHTEARMGVSSQQLGAAVHTAAPLFGR